MLFKREIASAALCFMLLSASQTSGAYGLTWIDKGYDFSKLKQVVCLPMPTNAPYGADINLVKESKRVKTEFASYGVPVEATKDMAELGKKIMAKTGANAFLVTEIVMNSNQTDHVEGKYFPVTMHEYTEVIGPEGKRTEHERYYDTNYYYAAHDVNMRKLEVDFHLYDAATGKRIFSFNDVRRSYDCNQDALFKEIAKEFFISLRDTPKQAEKLRNSKLDMDSVQLNGKVNDSDKAIRTFFLPEALYSELYIAGVKEQNKYFSDKGPSVYALRAKIFNYYDAPYWTEPSVSTGDKLVKSWSEKRKVRQEQAQPQRKETYTIQGNARPVEVNKTPYKFNPAPSKPIYKEVTIEHKLYRTEVKEQPGGYKFKANVTLNAQIFNKKTGTVVFSYNNSKTNDKRADAWKDLTKDFYNKLSKNIKKQ